MHKKNYSFEELTTLLKIKPYVLRFWESEFPQIASFENEEGDKVYPFESYEILGVIQKLLFEDKLSIPEAKNWFNKNPNYEDSQLETNGEFPSSSNMTNNENPSSFQGPGDVKSQILGCLDGILVRIDSLIESHKA